MRQLTSTKRSVSRVVMLVASLIFIALAIVCLTLWLFNTVIASSSLFGILTRGTQVEIKYSDLKKDYDKLYEQNSGDGFYVPPDFPIITYGMQWATITIESADVYDKPVVYGDDSKILLRNVGQFSNSRFPGQDGKCVLSAHVRGIFLKLETMQVGDVIELNTIYGDYKYTVTETMIIKETDGHIIQPEDGEDMLYLYTCYPAVSVVRRRQRFVVIAEKTEGKNWMGGLR